MNTASPAPPLAAEELTVERGGVRVLDRVSFTAGPGCLMGVVGPNGAGKSTLFNVIVSLLPATSGRVLVHSRSIAEARGLVAYVPQHERVNWRLPMSAWDVVLLGRTRRVGWFRRPGRQDRALAEEALRQVGMWDRRSSLVGELSGGQRQRVCRPRPGPGGGHHPAGRGFQRGGHRIPGIAGVRPDGASGPGSHHLDVIA